MKISSFNNYMSYRNVRQILESQAPALVQFKSNNIVSIVPKKAIAKKSGFAKFFAAFLSVLGLSGKSKEVLNEKAIMELLDRKKADARDSRKDIEQIMNNEYLKKCSIQEQNKVLLMTRDMNVLLNVQMREIELAREEFLKKFNKKELNMMAVKNVLNYWDERLSRRDGDYNGIKESCFNIIKTVQLKDEIVILNNRKQEYIRMFKTEELNNKAKRDYLDSSLHSGNSMSTILAQLEGQTDVDISDITTLLSKMTAEINLKERELSELQSKIVCPYLNR